MSISGLVIVYHPDIPELLANISTYLPYLDKLLVFDNSTGNCRERENILRGYDPRIQYIGSGQNLGLSGALQRGLEVLAAQGYAWSLTMDQDSSFPDPTFLIYGRQHAKRLQQEQVGILAPDTWGKSKGPALSLESTTVVITSGSLTNLQAFHHIGGFNERLFIDEVDHDFCLRLQLGGFRVLTLCKAPMQHALGTTEVVQRWGKRRELVVHNPMRYYYMCRNNLYMWHTYAEAFPDYIRLRKKEFRSLVKQILLYQPQDRALKIHYLLKGYIDYKKNLFGPLPPTP